MTQRRTIPIDLRDHTEAEDGERMHMIQHPLAEQLHLDMLAMAEDYIRTMNNDTEKTKPICAGCLISMFSNMMREMLYQGKATWRDTAGWCGAVSHEFGEMHTDAMRRGNAEGPDTLTYKDKGPEWSFDNASEETAH